MKLGNNEEAVYKSTIGSWSISPESGIVSCGTGDETYLEPRLAKLFYVLSENANIMVPRKQLIDQIWCDTIVNEESLTRAISDLRKTLKKHFDNPPQIQTIPKRGYRMIISMSRIRRSFWMVALEYIVYILVAFILIILIIRGLNY